MKIINASVEIVNVANREEGTALLRRIEWCGRISHRSEDAQTETSWERFLEAVVLQHGDWSIVEHASATVLFTVDRGITHEIVRHRLAAYTQESTRFVNYEKKMPPAFIYPMDPAQPGAGLWRLAMDGAEKSYKALITAGYTPQIARSVFPNALAAQLVMTCNLRNWRHFLLMRTTKESHPQMREVTIPLLECFKARIPLLFDDIAPGARQADNMKKAR